MPRTTRTPEGISITYYASAPGITYEVSTSTNLADPQAWGTTGVTLSDVDAEGRRTATMTLESAMRFLQLNFTPNP